MFKTIRRYYWLSQVFIKKHSQIILRSTLAILILVFIAVIFTKYLPTPKDVTRIGRVGKYTLSSIPLDIEGSVSEGLVTIGKNGEFGPGLAKSWTISTDGKVYTFKLDESKVWHDNTSVKTADINYNFADVLVEKTADSITFTLNEPFAPFLHAMSQPIFKKDTLGTKEYRITKTKLVSGNLQTISLENETERLIYKIYPTESAAITAYKLGEVQKLDNLSSVPEDISKDATNIITPNTNFQKTTALFINNQDSLLQSKTTRQGLAYAIKDKQFGHERSLSPISKNSWSYNNLVKDYDYDPTRAKTLFTQDVANPGDTKLELKTMLPYLEQAESIAANWEEVLGIKVDVKVVSSISSEYQIILADFAPPLDPDQYTLWHSTQPTNFTHYSNLKVDKLLEDGRRTLDFKLRKDIYQDFQRFLIEDCPAIFLFDTSSYSISRNTLL